MFQVKKMMEYQKITNFLGNAFEKVPIFVTKKMDKMDKLLDDKIKANQAQYDSDREAIKISALSSDELEKYEYLPGEDLGYKPGEVEKTKFEYYPLGNFFNEAFTKKWNEVYDQCGNADNSYKPSKQIRFKHQCYNQIYVITVMQVLLSKELLLL